MLTDFPAFVTRMLDAKNNKAEQAACFLWWSERRDDCSSLTIDQICAYFERARLAQPNRSRLEKELRALRYVTRSKTGEYRLTHEGVDLGNKLFAVFCP